MTTRRAAALVAALTALVLAACGDDSASSTPTTIHETNTTSAAPATTPTTAPSTSTTTPAPPVDTTPSTTAPSTTAPAPAGRTIVDARGVEVTIASTERVIPLDGDLAEIVFALGAGDSVVATDLSATYPPEADALPQYGYQRALAAEPIAAFEPTLLLATDLAGPPEVLDELERIGIPLVIIPSEPTPTGAADKIRAVAEALDLADAGSALADEVQARIDAAAAPSFTLPPRVVTLYLRGGQARLVFGPAYNTHWLIEAAGGVDLAGELGVEESADISDEAILLAAPDVLLVTTSGLESVGGIEGLLEEIPALAETPAGRQRAVIAYDAQLLLGNGPRTGELLEQMITDLTDIVQMRTNP